MVLWSLRIPWNLKVQGGSLPSGLRTTTQVAPQPQQSCAPLLEGGKGRTTFPVSAGCPGQSPWVLWTLRSTVSWVQWLSGGRGQGLRTGGSVDGLAGGHRGARQEWPFPTAWRLQKLEWEGWSPRGILRRPDNRTGCPEHWSRGGGLPKGPEHWS